MLLSLYMHVVGCILWKLFKVEQVWVPPKEFGSVPLDYLTDEVTKTKPVFQNYIEMVYHACFAFNLVDIAPRSSLEIGVVTTLFIASAFYNA